MNANVHTPGIPGEAAHRMSAFLTQHPALHIGSVGQSPLLGGAKRDVIHDIALKGDAPAFDARYLDMLLAVRETNRNLFTALEGTQAYEAKDWRKQGKAGEHQGGGVMSIHRGEVLEKAAVNMSVVWGDSYPSIEKDYAGKPFAAAGVSLICHPFNPNAPIAHMNVRSLRVGEGQDSVTWIGGGADLTPMVRFEQDTSEFHAAMRDVCERDKKADYDRYKAWCDEYFFIPHRGDTRGVGGIFFDYVHIGHVDECAILLDLGQAFARVYGTILARRVEMPYDADLKERHLHWRGRYAEFNLVYDRGTRFGLMSGGNTEAILASLPPVVKW
jgi:coproporphyrinogen III oxidase